MTRLIGEAMTRYGDLLLPAPALDFFADDEEGEHASLPHFAIGTPISQNLVNQPHYLGVKRCAHFIFSLVW